MRANWPPKRSDNTPRLLQAIDWNQAVQWVYSTTKATNLGCLTLFQIYFANDCPQQAYITLRIQATGPMWIYINGVYVTFICCGYQEITLPVTCGNNLIEVFVYDIGTYLPGIRYEILQNYCYSCQNSLAGFYNRETCQC